MQEMYLQEIEENSMECSNNVEHSYIYLNLNLLNRDMQKFGITTKKKCQSITEIFQCIKINNYNQMYK